MNPNNRPPHPTTAGGYYSSSSGNNNNVVGGGGFNQQQNHSSSGIPPHNRQGFPTGQGRTNQNGPIVQNRQQHPPRNVNNPNTNPNNIPSTMQQNRKKHPSGSQSSYPTQPHQSYHNNTTGSGFSTQAGHKATFGKKGQEVVVEQLSAKLGFPDVFLCEQNSSRPVMELSFTPSTARDGYVDKSFSYIDREPIDSHGTHFFNNDFYNLLEKSEQTLRDEYKTFSTNKTREEMKQRFENAYNSCSCTANNSFFPKLTDTGTMFKALAGRPDEQKRSSLASSRTSLRELASKLSRYYVKPNFFELLAQNNIPFFRALWYTKILIRDINTNITNVKDLAQDLTTKFCDYLLTSCNDDSTDPKKKNSIVYTINFLSYCLEENLLNENVLGQRLLEILEIKFGIKPKASKDTPLMDAYFFSLLYVKTSDQIYQQLSTTIQSSKKVGSVIKFYVLQLFKLFMMHSSDPKFTFEIFRRLNPGQQQLSLDSVKNLFCKIKDDIYAINVLDRHNCNIPELYNILLNNKEVGVQLISTICKWAITPKRFQNYRPYIAGTLVNNFIKQNPTMKKQVEDTLFKEVLNYSEEPTPDTYKNMLKLFNELILQNNFSISEYIKYLTSRGFNVAKTDEFNTRHTNILKNLPSYDPNTKNKIYSKLYGTKHEIVRKNQQTETEIQENIFKLINGGSDHNISSIIESMTLLPENGMQFEITQQIAEHVKTMDLAYLSEQTIDSILAIMISVSNLRAFRDIVYNITTKLISGEFKSPNLEIKMFSIIKNSLQLFISLDDSDIIDIFQKRFKTTNNRNIQSIIHRYITEISTTPNADPFKTKITKFTNDCNVIPAPINIEQSPTIHPFTQYIQSQDIILIPSNILVSELTKSPTKFSNDQLKHLIEVLFEKFQKHRVDTYITVLRDMYTFSHLLSDTSIIECFKDFIISTLDSTQYIREKHSSLILFCMKAVTCGVLSGYTFLNHILFNVFDNLKSKVATISKPNPQVQAITSIHAMLSSTKTSIFQHVNFIRVFSNFSRCLSKERITTLANNCGISEEVEAVDREIYEDVKTTLLYDFLGPIEAKETIHKMSISCKSIHDNVKSSKKSTKDIFAFSSLVYEAMIEILLDYLSNEKSLQDISRTLSYTQDCLGPLYELPSLQTKPKEGDGTGKSNSKDSDYGNKYQAITTLVANLCKPFSTIRDMVPEKLFSFLSQSTSINDYLQFIMSLSNQSDKWRIALDSQLLFLFMFTWNRRKALTKEQYHHFVARKGQENSFYFYAKSLLLTSFYPPFSELQDVILDHFKLSINYSEKRQQDIEALLPIVEELIRLDFSKAETACKCILDAIQAISNPSSSQSSTPGTPTPHSFPSTRERLTTCLLCLKEIIFSSPLLESHEDKFGERKRTTTVPQIKSILINLCTNKILPSVFNTPIQKPEDVALYDIYYLIYGMLAKLKIPQEELNKEFEKLFQKENNLQVSNPRTIQVGTPVSTPTSSRRTPTPGGASKMSPIISPQQSPVPMSPQVATVRQEQNRVISSWFVIEDYVSNCSHCNSCHGNLTPARFQGKVVKKTELIFAKKPETVNSSNPFQPH
ncbi:hypothetical protein NAEGRDRAFT_78416 [Naegleria gruberi]|uniref:Mediator complex subunit Med12 domain-containing protein n=1 Tax=Naegleria gruberi TaxID=5762 RepID=D2V3J2_NAEGR|nr:uncharacterized protein NAEGRDRAFT_78416 [Naegleria gruberi]EFC48647.1 hypothetical protein NAEGRDRAFT_78416 [Naegleria gruberi]|eukprot:XP_002681391.1 hypothetical protein NAEGRDRAFT_78416 [Naegleria gruberi strain NEG-M]